MTQIENEFGNYGYSDYPRDKNHLKFIKKVLRDGGRDWFSVIFCPSLSFWHFLSSYVFRHLPIYQLSIYLYIYLSIYLSTWQGIESLLFTSDTPELTADWGNIDYELMTANFKCNSEAELKRLKVGEYGIDSRDIYIYHTWKKVGILATGGRRFVAKNEV